MSNTSNTQKRSVFLLDFAGFYESVHGQAIDDASVDPFQDDQGECQAPEAFHDAFGYSGKMLEAYCKAYVDRLSTHLADEHGIELNSMAFEWLHSPFEYNFSTDRIFVTLDEADIQKLYDHMLQNKDVMRQLLVDNFTPCSGFVPHYSNDLDRWLAKDLSAWDHNELSMLIAVAADGGWNDMDILGQSDTFQEEVIQLVAEHMPEKAGKILKDWESSQAA